MLRLLRDGRALWHKPSTTTFAATQAPMRWHRRQTEHTTNHRETTARRAIAETCAMQFKLGKIKNPPSTTHPMPRRCFLQLLAACGLTSVALQASCPRALLLLECRKHDEAMATDRAPGDLSQPCLATEVLRLDLEHLLKGAYTHCLLAVVKVGVISLIPPHPHPKGGSTAQLIRIAEIKRVTWDSLCVFPVRALEDAISVTTTKSLAPCMPRGKGGAGGARDAAVPSTCAVLMREAHACEK